jgi:glucose dehydrogenase
MAGRWPRLALFGVLGLIVIAVVIVLVLRSHGAPPGDGRRTAYGAPALARPAAAAAAGHVEGEWHIAAGDYANTRYSDLGQITAQNVGELKPVFTFDTGFQKGHEAAPLAVGSTMYLITPYPNVVYVLDLTRPNQPVKWRFDPKPNPKSQDIACCDGFSRSVSYDNGRLFFVTLDGQVIALDANSGEQVWRMPIADITTGETVTMTPLVAAGKVPVGDSGGEMGVRGSLTALDALCGRVADPHRRARLAAP